MYPIKLKLENFLSFKKLELNFENKAILIQGENRTEDDQESNGSGKSAIEEGVFYAFTGSSLVSRNAVDLINYDEEDAMIELYLYCPIRKETLIIERNIYRKGTGKLSLYKDDLFSPIKIATVNDGEKYILNWTKIDTKDLKNYFIVSKENFKSFFKASNTEKGDLISRFTNTSCIDKTKQIIEKEVKEEEGKLEKKVQMKSKYEGQLSAYEDLYLKESNRNIESERIDFVNEQHEKIKDIDIKISDIEDKIMLQSHAIKTNKNDVEEKNKEIKDLLKKIKEKEKNNVFDEYINKVEEELRITNKEIKETNLEKRSLTEEQSEIEKSIERIKVTLSGVIVCPNCKHEFFIKSNSTPEELRKELKKNEVSYSETKELIDTYSLALTELKECIEILEQEYSNIKTKKIKYENKIMEIKSQVKSCELDLESFKNQEFLYRSNIERFGKEIESLEEEKERCQNNIVKSSEIIISKDLKEYEEQILANEEEIKKQDKLITEQQEIIQNKNRWIIRFKEFKSYIAMKQIVMIQNYTNHFLQKMKSDLRVKIEGFKSDSKGNLKEEITSYVIRDGIEKKYWSCSGGERARLDLAVILSIQKMINDTNEYGGLNFLQIDEVLEGLDGLGLKNIMKSLEEFQFPILLTTHVTMKGVAQNSIKVIKEKGVSYVE